MKAVPVNMRSPGPSDCATTQAQKDHLDCAGEALPSGRGAELQDSSTVTIGHKKNNTHTVRLSGQKEKSFLGFFYVDLYKFWTVTKN